VEWLGKNRGALSLSRWVVEKGGIIGNEQGAIGKQEESRNKGQDTRDNDIYLGGQQMLKPVQDDSKSYYSS